MLAPKLEEKTGRVLSKLTELFVYLGGALLCFLGLMTVASIIGRALIPFGLKPIPGDFELVEMGTAVAVFAFLPWCQLQGGHVAVDVLSRRFPKWIEECLILLGNAVIALAAVTLTWRMWMGMGERLTWFDQGIRNALGFGYKPFAPESTYILGMPLWIGYMGAVIGGILFSLVALYTVWRSVNRVAEARA